MSHIRVKISSLLGTLKEFEHNATIRLPSSSFTVDIIAICIESLYHALKCIIRNVRSATQCAVSLIQNPTIFECSADLYILRANNSSR